MTSEFVLEAITFTAGSVLSLIHLLLISYTAIVWARHYFKDQPLSIQLSCVAVAIYWLFGAVFAPLIILGKFDRTWTALSIGVIALAAWQMWGRTRPVCRELYTTLKYAAKLTWRSLPSTVKFLFIAVWAVALIRFSRGLIAPPLAWDALTYHLLKAGRWVQSGGWVFDNAPDSWQFYEYFPPLGDVYFAWAMLGTHTDAWLAVAGILIYTSCFTSAFSLGKAFGLDSKRSTMVALVTVSVPAVSAFITASYVDNTALALVTYGCSLSLLAVKSGHNKIAGVAVIAMALAAGIKITFLPFLLLALLVFLCIGIKIPTGSKLFISVFFCATCALSWQIYLTLVGKTPFYPAPFSLLGFTIEPGQPEFIKHHYEVDFWLPYMWEMPNSFAKFLLYDVNFIPTHLNFTWTFPIVLILGFLGLYGTARKSSARVAIIIYSQLLCGLLIFAAFWSPGAAFYRGIWIENMGRFFTSFFVLLVVGSVALSIRYSSYLAALLIAVNVLAAWPKEWVLVDYLAVSLGAAAIVLNLAAGLLFRVVAKSIAITVIAASSIASFLLIMQIRDVLRYTFYSQTSKTYDVMIPGILPFPAEPARLLDQHKDIIINFSTDYQVITNRWFRYLFLGSNLQNEVIYIPPTADGSPWSKSVVPSKELDYRRWRHALLKNDVDFHLSLIPHPEEGLWAATHPKDFNLIATDPKSYWLLTEIIK